MGESPRRAYESAARERLAFETRQSILRAARELFVQRGYEATTIDAIASRAGRAPQTVTAIFGNKRGILAEVLKDRAFGSGYEELIHQIRRGVAAVQRLRLVGRIAAQIYSSAGDEFDLLHAARALAPELAELEREMEAQRREKQIIVAESLATASELRRGISTAEAADILWALTGYDVYRMLVVERGWSARKYAAWLGDQLARALLD